MEIGEIKQTSTFAVNIVTIGSSSSGNCTLVYNSDTHILIDAGIPVKHVIEKVRPVYGMPEDKYPHWKPNFDGVFITHEHSDHIKSAGALNRKLKTPIFVSPLVRDKKPTEFEKCSYLHDINDVDKVVINSMTIQPFSTKHDAVQALGFIISDQDTVFGYVTDTGSISKSMKTAILNCKSLMLECDYDEELLAEYGGYSRDLKDRISSSFGHLSNQMALEFIKTSLDINALKAIVIGHLSQNTNTPEKFIERMKIAFPDPVHQAKFHIAPFNGALEV
jgi:phosphoribosyl 1,2-cyclic phosphodiesterase